MWMGAGGVLALFLSIWVWVWALGSAAGRPPSHWGPRLSMMSAVVLALPLVSSSALLLQRERLVTLARPDERTELAASIDASGGETTILLALLGLGLILVAWYLSRRSSSARSKVAPSWSVPVLASILTLAALAAWSLAQLAQPLGLAPLTSTFWLVALGSGWATTVLGILYGMGVAVAALRA